MLNYQRVHIACVAGEDNHHIRSKAMSDAPVAVKPRVRVVAAAPAAAADSRAAVAVTGAACRFPLEGTTPAEMWEQLVGKTETWRMMLR